MEERKKIKKFEKMRMFMSVIGWFSLLISALTLSLGATITGGVFLGVMLVLVALSIALSIKIQEYSLLKQIFHFKGQFPQLENYGFSIASEISNGEDTVYTRITPRGNNTYTVYINFDKQIYCEKNGKEVPEFNFVISDLIRDGLVTVEREVL